MSIVDVEATGRGVLIMPNYDYCCTSCDETFEIFHAMDDKPIVVCPSCKSKNTKKIPSACGFSISKNTTMMRQAKDDFRKQGAMRMELREDYGLHTVSPLAGKTFGDVYTDVKSRGDFVKEEMAKSAENEAAKKKAKQKEWKAKAQKRAPARGREMERRQAAEAADKRAIRIQSV